MGLNKEFKQINGMVAAYHRIDTIIKNGDRVDIKVVSYVDKNTRLKEKQVISWKEIFDDALETVDQEKMDKLIKDVGPNYKEIKQFGTDYSVSSCMISLSYSKDLNNNLSMENIYSVLEKSGKFKGSMEE